MYLAVGHGTRGKIIRQLRRGPLAAGRLQRRSQQWRLNYACQLRELTLVVSQSFIKAHLFSFDSVSFLFVSVTQTDSSRRFEEKLRPRYEPSGMFLGRRQEVRLLATVVVENRFFGEREIKLAA